MGTDEDKTPVTLETLNKRLDEVRKLQPESTTQTKVPRDAARAAVDFASATAVGIGLGYGFDAWQGTLPWGLLVGLALGTATGMKLMFQDLERTARESDEANKTKHD